jgi:6-phosphogluconolactonase (cycloisomerase 2 family)
MVAHGAIVGLAWPLHAQFVYVTNTKKGDRKSLMSERMRRLRGIFMKKSSPIVALAMIFGFLAVPHTAIANQFVYVANKFDDAVSGYKITPSSGALTPVPGGAFPAGTGPVSVAVISSVVQKVSYLYVANKLDDTVSGYKIESTGALTPVPGSPFKTGHSPVSVTAAETQDPHKFVVYVANSESDTVSAYVADEATGTLNEWFGKPFETGNHPDSVATGTQGPRFGQLVLFVANLRSGTVSIYGGSGGMFC